VWLKKVNCPLHWGQTFKSFKTLTHFYKPEEVRSQGDKRDKGGQASLKYLSLVDFSLLSQ
jgi:hypothetical protein